MADYSNPNTRLTASKYACSITAAQPPRADGTYISQQIDGSYVPRPGATVKAMLDEWRHDFARRWDVPVKNVTIVRYSLREA